MKDLHQYLEEYERKHPEDVVHIEQSVSADQEITALVFELEARKQYPILIFHQVKTVNGGISPFPMTVNLLASRSRCAELIGSTFENISMDYCLKTATERRKPLKIAREDAPVKEIVKTGDQVNLFELPALSPHYMDPGPYFTAGFFTHYDPDSGIDNSSLHRGWIIDRNKVRVYPTAHSHSKKTVDKYLARGEKMPIAYWVGHHPAACLGAQVRLPYPGSHFEAMGGLLGEPVRMVPSETLGEDFLVPADAEFIVEGYLDPTRLYPEGPFGEYTGYIGPQVINPQVEITAITHRQNPYFHNLLVGHADNQIMGGFAIEGVVYEAVKQRVPSLKNVYMPLSGTCRFHAYLQLENPNEGDAREAIMVALTVDPRLKYVYIFDTDVDIFNERDVLWAISTRTQWDKDLMVFPGCRGIELDPTITGYITTKGGMDCTKPPGEVFMERIRVSDEVAARIKLEDFIAADKLQALAVEEQ